MYKKDESLSFEDSSDEFDVDKGMFKRVINPMQMQWNRTAAIVRVIVKRNTEDKGAEGDN